MNPLVPNTDRDASTAWQTADGEYRFIAHGRTIYGSMDFREWYSIGVAEDFTDGECPSFFPLPKTSPGNWKTPPQDAPVPTHVSKYSFLWHSQDFFQIGVYVEGKPKKLGNWTSIDMSERSL